MKADDVKLWASHGTAVALAIGGFVVTTLLLLVGAIESDVAFPALIGLANLGAVFLLQQESATRAVKSFEKVLNTPQPPDNEVKP